MNRFILSILLVLVITTASACVVPEPQTGADTPQQSADQPTGETSQHDNANEPASDTSQPEDRAQEGEGLGIPESLHFDQATAYDAGMYRVGTDLNAGIYLAVNDGSILSAITVRDGSGSDAKTLTIDPFSTHTMIEVIDGVYLDLSGAVMYEAVYTYELIQQMFEQSGAYSEGMYWVGFHIPPGEYKLTADEDSILSSYTVYRDAAQSSIANISVMSGQTAYVTVEAGQFIKLNGASMIPV